MKYLITLFYFYFSKGSTYYASFTTERRPNSNAATRTKTQYSCFERANSSKDGWDVASNLIKKLTGYKNFFYFNNFFKF